MEGYYSDGITKFTDPFWILECHDCNKKNWLIMHSPSCPVCGSTHIKCTNRRVEEREKNALVGNIPEVQRI